MKAHAISLATALTLTGLLALTACSRSSGPSHETTATATTAAANTTNAPSTMIGRQVELAMEKARKEMLANNLDISGGMNIDMNGHRFVRPAGLTKAEITPQGDLLIADKPVTVTPEQRALLLAYRGEVIGVASAGMTLGSQGADLGISALTGLPGVLLGGKEGQNAYQQRMEAQGKRMESDALALCKQLPPMLATQQQLATSLPEFKPYATMTQHDIDDCAKDLRARGVSTNDH
jgi:hypothetical protein